MKITKVDSLDDAALEPYRTMRRTMEHRANGIFVAEGEKVVRRLLESNLEVLSLLLTPEWFEQYSTILTDRKVEQGAFIAAKERLEDIVGFGLHQGIMAIGKAPEQLDVAEFARKCHTPRLFVAADGIANAENMGVIARSCAAFGVRALIVGESSCDPYLRRSVRNSMGTIFSLPVAKVDKLSSVLESLRDEFSIKVIAADPKNESEDVSAADLTGDICLVFGSEGDGISREVMERCSERIKIAMYHGVDSINVAVSVGVILYETARQRNAAKSWS